MKQLAQGGVTMVVVTHEMTLPRDGGNHVVFMDPGEVASSKILRRILHQSQGRADQTVSIHILSDAGL